MHIKRKVDWFYVSRFLAGVHTGMVLSLGAFVNPGWYVIGVLFALCYYLTGWFDRR